MIPAGTTLTVQVSGSADSFWTSPAFWRGTDTDSLRSAVNIALEPYMVVKQHTIEDRGVTDVGTWQYRATLVVAPLVSHAQAEDVYAIIAHAFYVETDYYPNVGATQPPLAPPGIDIPNIPNEIKDTAFQAIALLGLVIVAAVFAFGKSGGRLL